jgi:triosephosphate isomerase
MDARHQRNIVGRWSERRNRVKESQEIDLAKAIRELECSIATLRSLSGILCVRTSEENREQTGGKTDGQRHKISRGSVGRVVGRI